MATVVVIQKLGLGSLSPSDESFTIEMLDRFLHSLELPGLRPSAICFYTDGVRAACSDSPVLLGLKLLEGAGVELLLCRSCLEHLQLQDKVVVGQIVTMKDIVQTLVTADRVLYP